MGKPRIELKAGKINVAGESLRIVNDTASGFSFRPMAAAAGGSGDRFGDDSDGEPHDDAGTATITKSKSQTKTPRLYRVMLMNDDFTPMEFVILVLQKFFQKNMEEATQIMLQVHHQGAGLCGVFSYEIAETKVYQVNQFAKQNRHPLKSTMDAT